MYYHHYSNTRRSLLRTVATALQLEKHCGKRPAEHKFSHSRWRITSFCSKRPWRLVSVSFPPRLMHVSPMHNIHFSLFQDMLLDSSRLPFVIDSIYRNQLGGLRWLLRAWDDASIFEVSSILCFPWRSLSKRILGAPEWGGRQEVML